MPNRDADVVLYLVFNSVFYLVKIDKLIFLYLDADVTFF